MKILLVDEDQIHGGLVELTRDQRHHLVTVQRMREGEEVHVVRDGPGVSQSARLEGKDRLVLVGSEIAVPLPRRPVTMGVGLIRGPLMDRIVEDLTALGVDGITWLELQRSCKSPPPRRDRSERLVRKAREQSGRLHPVEIVDGTTLEECLSDHAPGTEVVLFTADGDAGSWSELGRAERPTSCLGLIGPEGDFTPAEIRTARESGALTVRLDLPVLRTELATVVAATLLLERCSRL